VPCSLSPVGKYEAGARSFYENVYAELEALPARPSPAVDAFVQTLYPET
jgi:hypothetical protein